MAIEFRGVRFPPLDDLTVSAPDGAVIGVIGEKGAGKNALLRLAAGTAQPEAGDVIAKGERRYIGPSDPLQLSPVDLLAIEHSLAHHDALVRARARAGIDRLRIAGTTVLIVSHELDLLCSMCDEVWWLEAGRLAGRGDPREVLDAYREHIAEKVRAWGATLRNPLRTTARHGDGRAGIVSLETLDAAGKPTMVWRSGEDASIRVAVRYREPVEEPVIGILIRTRIGLEVYGTNTELEKIATGKYAAGDILQIDFRFRCDLCPGEYTLTAASHDADGTAHDWIDDAVAFQVADSRYTAGVANLRAKVEVKKLGGPAVTSVPG
ncbi:MAG TPA: Wzt carbohydrate-binding domain-containing protein [Bryobacteraceae bacterium]|nr:Wzt carbohydrate-binding domain-containing protein [Bryobacteraceae bacterium]